MDMPRPGEIVTVDAMIFAMRSCFDAEAGRGVHVSYEMSLDDSVFRWSLRWWWSVAAAHGGPGAVYWAGLGAAVVLYWCVGIATGAYITGDPAVVVHQGFDG